MHAEQRHRGSPRPAGDIDVGDLLSRIDANEAQIGSAGVNLAGYVAPGDEHTVVGDAKFYTRRSTASHSSTG